MGTTSTATVTRTQIIEDALAELGNVDPDNTQQAKSVRVLNKLLKELDPMANWGWTSTYVPETFFTVINQRAYVTGTGPNDISANIYELKKVERVEGPSQFRDIDIIDQDTRLDFLERENRPAEPRFAFLQRQPTLAGQILDLLPTPNAIFTIQLTFRRRLFDFTASTDNPDFPGEWNRTLSLMLADAQAREYGMPIPQRQDLKAESLILKKEMIRANQRSLYHPTVLAEYF